MDTIARLIGDVLHSPEDEALMERVRGEVTELCRGSACRASRDRDRKS